MIDMQDAAYGYGAEPILSDMTLRLAPGSFHFLTGPSGSGKTTFLKLCYGELIATRGSVSVFGQDTATLDRDRMARSRQRIGVVNQDCEFLDHLPIAENIALPLTVSGRHAGAVMDSQLGLFRYEPPWIHEGRRDSDGRPGPVVDPARGRRRAGRRAHVNGVQQPRRGGWSPTRGAV